MKRIVDLIFLFGGKYIKPISKTLTSIIMLVIAIWGFAKDSLFEFLCSLGDSFAVLASMCQIEDSKFYTTMIGIIGMLQIISDKLEKMSPQELKLAGIDMPGWGWITGLFVVAFLILALTFGAVKFLQILIVILVFVGLFSGVNWLIKKA
jgi:hypothetical protein